MDLFAQSMIGDLMDASAAIPKETTSVRNVVTLEVDLFAEATFISASPQSEAASVSHSQVCDRFLKTIVPVFFLFFLYATDFPSIGSRSYRFLSLKNLISLMFSN